MPKPPIKECEWDFTDLTDSTPRLLDVCYWEYGRECQRLIDLISKLRSLLREQYPKLDPEGIARAALNLARISRGGMPTPTLKKSDNRALELSHLSLQCAEDLNAFMQHLNWGLFCSPEFPAMPWFDGKSKCPIRAGQGIFFEFPNSSLAKLSRTYDPRIVSLDLTQLFRRNGEKHDDSPDEDAIEAFWTSDDEGVSNLRSAIMESLPPPNSLGHSKVHCFIVHDTLLDFRSADGLIRFFSSKINEIYRRKIMRPVDVPKDISGQFPEKWKETSEKAHPIRQHETKWLSWLGILRLRCNYPLKKIDKIAADPKGSEKRAEWLRDNKKFSFARKRADEVFRILFPSLGSEKPISYPVFSKHGNGSDQRDERDIAASLKILASSGRRRA